MGLQSGLVSGKMVSGWWLVGWMDEWVMLVR